MIPTGLETLDIRLGGGLPRGAITEVFGSASSGKTALAFHFIKNALSENPLYINADQDFAEDWAERIGIDMDKFHVLSEPTSMLDAVIDCIATHDLIVIDTITNLLTTDKPVTSDGIDIGKTLNSQMEMLTARLLESNTALVILNQVRTPIRDGGYTRTTGGRLLKYYSSRRICVEGGGYIRTADNNSIGRTIHYKVLKTPGLQPYTRQKLSLMYDTGISNELDALRLGLQLGLLSRSGSWIYKNLKDGSRIALGQGLQGTLRTLYSSSAWQSYSSELSLAVAAHKIKMTTINSSSAR